MTASYRQYWVHGVAVTISSFLVAALPGCSTQDAAPGDLKAAAIKSFAPAAEWAVETNGSVAAEILAASEDGQMLIFTDSPGKQLGFVDIATPETPKGMGVLALDGEPTSTTVVGGLALVGVNTSESFTAPSGHLAVVDIAGRSILARCDVGGQPDSVAVSPDRAYLAVAVENERDEDVDDGAIPQMPAGHLVIFDLQSVGMPANCDSARRVDLTGLAEVAGEDPEPEYVAINGSNVVAVTLQENNHIVLVDLASGQIESHFSAGKVDLLDVDFTDDGAFNPVESQYGVLREPDAVAWIDEGRLVTANEGDYEGGGRSFTIFNRSGSVLWDSGTETEQMAAKAGIYPDDRSDNKGTEPETVAVAEYGESKLIFVALERANAVAVYEMQGEQPVFRQLLRTGFGPEGVLPMPGRDMLAIANEADPGEGIASSISLFKLAQ